MAPSPAHEPLQACVYDTHRYALLALLAPTVGTVLEALLVALLVALLFGQAAAVFGQVAACACLALRSSSPALRLAPPIWVGFTMPNGQVKHENAEVERLTAAARAAQEEVRVLEGRQAAAGGAAAGAASPGQHEVDDAEGRARR
jgi:hypothetical protein